MCSDIVPSSSTHCGLLYDSAYIRGMKQDTSRERLSRCQEREKRKMRGNNSTHCHSLRNNRWLCKTVRRGYPDVGLQAHSTHATPKPNPGFMPSMRSLMIVDVGVAVSTEAVQKLDSCLIASSLFGCYRKGG